MTYTSRKINTGIYIATFSNGARVRIARYENGLWNTFLLSDEEAGRDSYLQTYVTKGDALKELLTCADELVA
jgi:hypothetical protein